MEAPHIDDLPWEESVRVRINDINHLNLTLPNGLLFSIYRWPDGDRYIILLYGNCNSLIGNWDCDKVTAQCVLIHAYQLAREPP